MTTNSKWWQNAVFYQIYPRSFKDSNGDGIGDIRGIREKIPYLKELGIDAVWLNPIYSSPNNDYGYDISDYQSIHPDYGTREEFEEMLREFHSQGMKVIMDLVVNHTSTEHSWFQSSREDPEGPYGDYYIWRDGKASGPPNNWNSFFGGSAWKYDPLRSQYYLHLFDEHQADLNWANTRVRNEVYRIMNWWTSLGIDGFRMDVINMISKDTSFPEDTRVLDPLVVKGTPYFVNGPKLHSYLREMRQKALSGDSEIFGVGECPGAEFDDVLQLSGYDREELDAVFQMDLMEIDHGKGGKWDIRPWSASDFLLRLSRWQQGLDGRAWPANFFANHDQPRPVSRFGNDGEYHYESASMLAVLLLSLTGTPFIYYGEEIGMPNADYLDISDYRDVDTLNFYHYEREKGKTEEELMNKIRYMSRDNARSPMQWTGDEYGGFSQQNPWIPLGRRYKEINVAHDRSGGPSIFAEYQKLISLRKNCPALSHGRFVPLKSEQQVVGFKKLQPEFQPEGDYLIYANMSKERVNVDLSELLSFPPDTAAVELVYSNYKNNQWEKKLKNRKQDLRPYEAYIVRILGDSDKELH